MKRLLSASEIAAMNLPGLPTSKPAIIAKAEREGWPSGEKTGLGGTRRVFELPERYLCEVVRETTASTATPSPLATAAGTSRVDLKMLQVVEATLEQWLQEKAIRLEPDRRGAVVALLYDYIVNKHADEEDIQRLLTLVSA